jgi:hypothetical protein
LKVKIYRRLNGVENVGEMGKSWLVVALALAVVILSASVGLLLYLRVSPQSEFIEIIELIENPDEFDNKTVKIKGTIIDFVEENHEENFTDFYIHDGSGGIYATARGRPLFSIGDNVIVKGVFHHGPASPQAPWIAWIDFISIQEIRKTT